MMPELKPCPFCGGAAFHRKNPKFCGCVNVGCFMVEASVTPKEWNARISATRPDGGDSLREALLEAAKLLGDEGNPGAEEHYRAIALAAKDGE